jgi:hypothetical protein
VSLPNDTGISKGIDNSKLGFIHRFNPASATGPKKIETNYLYYFYYTELEETKTTSFQ